MTHGRVPHAGPTPRTRHTECRSGHATRKLSAERHQPHGHRRMASTAGQAAPQAMC
ncbi:hypothetical protein FM125_01500 [Micrococcus lylae]|uniref:Uncharacterized protein n=1 Tax=Micrococcus lylae TaxID=1273 RepID=A0A1R4ICJ7_9MICC|nr:hypothetical protein FM125_01500 [Micrococcus lylae]